MLVTSSRAGTQARSQAGARIQIIREGGGVGSKFTG